MNKEQLHPLIEGNMIDLFQDQSLQDQRESQEIHSRLQNEYLGRGKVIYEIGKRTMRRITRDGKR